MKNKINKIAISQTDGTTKCYVDINDFKREIKSRDSKIKNLELKLEKKKYKVGDEVKWCNFDWIVIKTGTKLQNITIDLPGFMVTEENTVTLMLKNTIQNMTYSDNNSNDYKESNVKKYLENEFINKLDKSKLIEMRTNYDEDKYVDSLVRIPTIRDIEALPMSIRNCGIFYWTMTGSYAKSEDCPYAYVFFVDSNGYLGAGSVGVTSYGLRPVITLRTETL